MKSQAQLHDEAERSGWWRPFAEYDEQPQREIKPPRVKRIKQLTPNARLRTPAYKAGKKARAEGVYRNRNPHPDGTLENELWDDGWNSIGAKR